MNYAKYDVVNNIIEMLLNNQKNIFGDKLLGSYLYGSLIWGDFDIKTSDIDTLCVIRSEITTEELEKLQVMHEEIVAENPEWRNRIEVHYAPIDGIRNFRTNAFKMGNISPGEPFHIIDRFFITVDDKIDFAK